MYSEIITQKIQKYSFVFNDEHEIVGQTPIEGEFDIFEETHLYSENGFVLVRKSPREVLGNHVLIGTSDKVDNYEEIARETV